jgi:acyl-CoA synthetase (AMP-forming)/AMP-acid ligase II
MLNYNLANTMIARCEQIIAGYKCPHSVEFRAALPMTGAGKFKNRNCASHFGKPSLAP